jgi:hypothetical protein
MQIAQIAQKAAARDVRQHRAQLLVAEETGTQD